MEKEQRYLKWERQQIETNIEKYKRNQTTCTYSVLYIILHTTSTKPNDKNKEQQKSIQFYMKTK